MQIPEDESYRTCTECGMDCQPEIFTTEDKSARIVFMCPEHGIHSVISPFEA